MERKRRKTAEELHLKDVLSITNKNSLKRLIQDEISTKILDVIENKTQTKPMSSTGRRERKTYRSEKDRPTWTNYQENNAMP